jgi:hypothetical protein
MEARPSFVRSHAAAAALLAFACAAHATPPLYVATELVSPGDGLPLTPVAINDLHAIAGTQATPDGGSVGFTLKDGRFETFRAFPHGRTTNVTAMNAHGDIVGTGSNPTETWAPKSDRGFIRKGRVTTEIHVFPEGQSQPGHLVVSGLNAAGTVVGAWYERPGKPLFGFMWTDGQTTWPLNVPFKKKIESGNWNIFDITNDGIWVVTGNNHFRPDDAWTSLQGGGLIDMGHWGDDGATVRRVRMQAGTGVQLSVGDTSYPGGTRLGAVYRYSVLTWLAGLGGAPSALLDVNESAAAVGWSNDANGVRRAMYWDFGDQFNGASYDLNDYASVPGITLNDAVAINDFGEILAFGVDTSNATHAYLLTPQ